MTSFFNIITGNLRGAALLALGLCTGATALSPRAARAADDGRYGDRYGRDYRHTVEHRYDRVDRCDNDRGRAQTDLRFEINFGSGPSTFRHERELPPRYTERRVRYWVEPQYRVVTERVWVEPIYRTVTDRVWVPAVYRIVYTEEYIPARYEVREIVRYDGRRKVVSRDRTLIEPGHTVRVPRQICESEGHWETVERRISVSEGRWDEVKRQVCVSEGHWDERVERGW